MARNKKTHQEFYEQVKKLTNNEYELLSKYESPDIPVLLKHTKGCGGTFEMKPTNFIGGGRCKACKPHITRKVLSNYRKSKIGR